MLISYKCKNLKHFFTNKCTYRLEKALGNEKRHQAAVLQEGGACSQMQSLASKLKKPLCWLTQDKRKSGYSQEIFLSDQLQHWYKPVWVRRTGVLHGAYRLHVGPTCRHSWKRQSITGKEKRCFSKRIHYPPSFPYFDSNSTTYTKFKFKY